MTSIQELAYPLFAWAYSRYVGHSESDSSLPIVAGNSDFEPDNSAASIVFYAATIGELQAALPVVSYLENDFPELQIVVLAGQPQYVESFRQMCPKADVGIPPGPDFRSVTAFFERVSPRLVVLSEGPCLHSRFPIRLGLGLPAACLKFDVPMIVTNACLYELSLGSRIDKLEYRWFRDLHKRAIRRWYAASIVQEGELVAAGVPAPSISIVGDLKFDNLDAVRDRKMPEGLEPLLADLKSYPLVVGASLNNGAEEEALLAGWKILREVEPEARLVLAPRYVNRSEVMDRIYAMLQREGVAFCKRSAGTAPARGCDVLVVDVFGELTHYFSVADVCFMGRDHGVLEPLAFDKPMVAGNRSTWQEFNTSYPLYRLMIDGVGLVELKGLEEMGETLIRLVSDSKYREGYVERARAIVSNNQGATKRLCDEISGLLDQEMTIQPVTVVR